MNNPDRNRISGSGQVLIQSRINTPRGDPDYREAARRELERFNQERTRNRKSGQPEPRPQPTSRTTEDGYQPPVSTHPIHAGNQGEDDEYYGGWDIVMKGLFATAIISALAFVTLVWAMADDAQNNRPSSSLPPIPPGSSEKYAPNVEVDFPTLMETPTPAPVYGPAPVKPTLVKGIFLNGDNDNNTPNAIVCGWKGGKGNRDPVKLNRLVQSGKIVIETAGGGVVCVYSSNNPPEEDIDYLK